MKAEKKIRELYLEEYGVSFDVNAMMEASGLNPYHGKAGYVNPYRAARLGVYTVAGAAAAAFVVPLAIVVIAFADIGYSETLSRENLNLTSGQASELKSATFRAMNAIEYDTDTLHTAIEDDGFIADVNTFAENLFHSSGFSDNALYSPLGLYANMDLASLAVTEGDEETEAQFDLILGGTKESRAENIKTALLNNYYISESGARGESSVLMKQAAFVDYELGAAETFVSDATARRAEVYEADLSSKDDQELIATWASEAVGEDGYVTADQLGLTDEDTLLLMSTLSFESLWSDAFAAEDNVTDYFYPLEGDPYEIEYMNHTFYGLFEDCGDYVTFSDYYQSGYSIQYFVPKELEDDILTLLEGVDFLSESEEADYDYIALEVPRFSYDCEVDLTDVLIDMGLSNPFEEEANHMAGAYDNAGIVVESGLSRIKQKNSIEFNEDGTKAKSLSISFGFGAADAGPMSEGWSVQLNQPFVYCIRDLSDLPIFLGYVSDPAA